MLVTTLNDRPALLHNETAPAGHWLSVRLVGRRANRDGLGARLTLAAGALRQTGKCIPEAAISPTATRARTSAWVAITGADLLEVRWPSGIVDRLSGLSADQHLVIEEGRGVLPVAR